MPARLLIEFENQPLLEIGCGENALLPLAEGERRTAFVAVLNALALLAGLNPERISASTEGGVDQCLGGSGQCPPDHASDDCAHQDNGWTS